MREEHDETKAASQYDHSLKYAPPLKHDRYGNRITDGNGLYVKPISTSEEQKQEKEKPTQPTGAPHRLDAAAYARELRRKGVSDTQKQKKQKTKWKGHDDERGVETTKGALLRSHL